MAAAVTSAITTTRRLGAIIGCIVGDAAAQPSHWIYDPADKEKRGEGLKVPEFGPPRGVFYQQPEGEGKLSTYGDQAWLLLKHLKEHDGDLVVKDYEAEHVANFGPKTKYDIESIIGHKPEKEDMPVPGPWLHHSIITTLDNVKAGAKGDFRGDDKDDQADCTAKIAAVVAVFAGKDELEAKVEAAVRTSQNNDRAVAFTQVFAKLLEAVLLGKPISEALAGAIAYGKASSLDGAADAAKAMEEAIGNKDKDHAEWCNRSGPKTSSCAMPSSLANVAHLLTQIGDDVSSFAEAMRPTIAATGCNCSRSCMAGAVLGAALGLDGVPADWIEKTTDSGAIVDTAKALVAKIEA